jgi:hypothetical protein
MNGAIMKIGDKLSTEHISIINDFDGTQGLDFIIETEISIVGWKRPAINKPYEQFILNPGKWGRSAAYITKFMIQKQKGTWGFEHNCYEIKLNDIYDYPEEFQQEFDQYWYPIATTGNGSTHNITWVKYDDLINTASIIKLPYIIKNVTDVIDKKIDILKIAFKNLLKDFIEDGQFNSEKFYESTYCDDNICGIVEKALQISTENIHCNDWNTFWEKIEKILRNVGKEEFNISEETFNEST